MSNADAIVHVDMVASFRLLTPQSEPNFVVLRINTQDGKTYNFWLVSFAHTVTVWSFDLQAIARALERGAPLPGKLMGSPDRKVS
jgi:hypothetical protein